MKAWLTIPSARPAAQASACIRLWKQQGYGVALLRDFNAEPVPEADINYFTRYPGYAVSVNMLSKMVLADHSEVDWCIAAGDDTEPDLNHMADEIAEQCSDHFRNYFFSHAHYDDAERFNLFHPRAAATFGVMQPTGDRFAGGSIDRIAGSPWLGREWCKRANGGQGPFWPEFLHMFGDEALQRTAQKAGVFWQRRDLIHLHRHFMRKSDAIDSPAVQREIPPHLREANSPQHWEAMKAIFQRLERQDFAPCMPVSI